VKIATFTRKLSRPKLPKTHRGVPVARGKGLHYKEVDRIEEEEAYSHDEWPTGVFFLVIADNKNDRDVDGKVFGNWDTAVKYAKACANGNVNYRVIRATSELLVIATRNDL
jgi:hypothetical protein